MGEMIGEALAALAVGLLKALWAREDARAAVLRQVEKQHAGTAIQALQWKMVHPIDPGADPLAPERLRHDPDGPVPP